MPPPTALVHDPLTEAMLATSAAYFCDDEADRLQYREDLEAFFQANRLEGRLRDGRLRDGRLIFAAGLLVPEFVIGVDPVVVEAPHIPPHEAIDTELLYYNHHHIAPTLLDMGTFATMTDPPQPRYNERVVAAVTGDLALYFAQITPI